MRTFDSKGYSFTDVENCLAGRKKSKLEIDKGHEYLMEAMATNILIVNITEPIPLVISYIIGARMSQYEDLQQREIALGSLSNPLPPQLFSDIFKPCIELAGDKDFTCKAGKQDSHQR